MPFEAKLDVIEPMGMETLVYFTHRTARRCAAASTRTPARATAGRCRLAADLNNMHLIDDATGRVI